MYTPLNKSNSEDVYEIGMGSKDEITKTRNWINEIITNKDLTEGNKKGQVKEPEMLFYSTGRDAGDNEKYSVVCRYHKYRKCMRGAECKYRHPNVCQNIEEFGLCKGKCDLIHQLVCKSFWFKGF